VTRIARKLAQLFSFGIVVEVGVRRSLFSGQDLAGLFKVVSPFLPLPCRLDAREALKSSFFPLFLCARMPVGIIRIFAFFFSPFACSWNSNLPQNICPFPLCFSHRWLCSSPVGARLSPSPLFAAPKMRARAESSLLPPLLTNDKISGSLLLVVTTCLYPYSFQRSAEKHALSPFFFFFFLRARRRKLNFLRPESFRFLPPPSPSSPLSRKRQSAPPLSPFFLSDRVAELNHSFVSLRVGRRKKKFFPFLLSPGSRIIMTRFSFSGRRSQERAFPLSVTLEELLAAPPSFSHLPLGDEMNVMKPLPLSLPKEEGKSLLPPPLQASAQNDTSFLFFPPLLTDRHADVPHPFLSPFSPKASASLSSSFSPRSSRDRCAD